MMSCPISELEERMTYEEFICWQYYLTEPRGDKRADWHTAMITKSVYDFMLGFSKSRRKIKLNEMLLKFEKRDAYPENVAKKANIIFGGIIPKEVLNKAQKELQ